MNKILGYDDYNQWFKNTYPKLFGYITHVNMDDIYAIMEKYNAEYSSRGNLNYSLEKEFIIKYEHMHDMWIL